VHETKTYTIKNRNDHERTVVIEHPVRNDFKLVSTDQAVEKASDFYRFQIKVAPGKTAKQVVTEERVLQQLVQLMNLDDNTIRHFINQAVASEKVKAGLQKSMELRWAMQKTQREIAELQRQLDAIRNDQPRLPRSIRTTSRSCKALNTNNARTSRITSPPSPPSDRGNPTLARRLRLSAKPQAAISTASLRSSVPRPVRASRRRDPRRRYAHPLRDDGRYSGRRRISCRQHGWPRALGVKNVTPGAGS
jgi:hypothetical protein